MTFVIDAPTIDRVTPEVPEDIFEKPPDAQAPGSPDPNNDGLITSHSTPGTSRSPAGINIEGKENVSPRSPDSVDKTIEDSIASIGKSVQKIVAAQEVCAPPGATLPPDVETKLSDVFHLVNSVLEGASEQLSCRAETTPPDVDPCQDQDDEDEDCEGVVNVEENSD